MFVKKIFLCGLFFLFAAASAEAGAVDPLPAFTPEDRVLIFAPHPDDEAIGTGGVIQMARRAGAQVRVVLVTNGENNEFSFLVYKKRLIFRPKEILAMGELRRRESLSAMFSLGVGEEDILSLGYPDFGTMEIMTRYWGDMKPFRSMLSRVRKVPYETALSFGAPYLGESVLNDFRKVILDFRPTKVFVSHPADTNRDHRAVYLFLRVSLWDLDGKIEQPDVYPYLVHVVGWPKPRGYFPGRPSYIPKDFFKSDMKWSMLNLPPDTIQAKYDAIKRYVSQIKYAPKYLLTFARNSELFADYPVVSLVRQMVSEVVWQAVGSGDDGRPLQKGTSAEHISSLAYARQGNNFLVKISLRRTFERDMGISVFLLGYKTSVPFGEMPKLNLLTDIGGFHIKDRKKTVPVHDVQFIVNDKDIVFIVPLSLMGDPDLVLSCAKTSLYDLTIDETAWRVLSIQ